MNDHPNETRARQAIAAFARGDLDTYKKQFAPDVVWHVGGTHSLAGDYQGREALFQYFSNVRELTDASLDVEMQDVLADDRYCAVFARVTGRRGAKKLDSTMAQMFRVDEDGRWIEYWAAPEDQDAVDAFWS